MSAVCKMAENGQLTVDQKVKVVLFYAKTKECSSDSETLCKRLRGKTVVTLNIFFIRNNYPACEC